MADGKVRKVMGEFKRGTLRSGSGAKVTKRKQAVAIAMSEAGLSREQKRSMRGSGTFTKAEMRKGFRVLDKPTLKRGQTKVAFPGVPTRKS
ncbi:MAG: DUF6496 domain-containing protein [Geminicoccaceae bacterium]